MNNLVILVILEPYNWSAEDILVNNIQRDMSIVTRENRVCTSCNSAIVYSSNNEKKHPVLVLELGAKSVNLSVKTLISQAQNINKMDCYCPICQKVTSANRNVFIHQFPKYMFLKINRQDKTNNGKLLNAPVQINSSLKLMAVDGGEVCYHLVSFACFKDEHWTCVYQDENDKTWYSCDDLSDAIVLPTTLTECTTKLMQKDVSLLLYILSSPILKKRNKCGDNGPKKKAKAVIHFPIHASCIFVHPND